MSEELRPGTAIKKGGNMPEKKKWYASKTIWVNAIGLIGAILVGTGVIDNELSPETVASILVVANILLRFFTKESIT